MPSPIPSKRFALLVGIDLYLNDGSRKCEKGGYLSLPNLHGCVNDVRGIEKFLRSKFQMNKFCVLISPLTSSGLPTEPSDHWPTFDNIRREFNTIFEQASAGDILFFHFSGHGALLQSTSGSPLGRSTDPSLMTMDFCRGKPAVRGWQLNEWLKRFNEKKIQIIVILDSCHSAGAWRGTGESFRTPEGDWTTIPYLPADEEAITESATDTFSRDIELEMSWSINPDGFTLMAACESHEGAAEKTFDGISYGAFTHGLLECLEQTQSSEAIVTYRNLRDHIVKRVERQTPRVYGRDRLEFFGYEEPFLPTPIVVRIEGERIYIPIGKVHGVQEWSGFTTYPPAAHATFTVDQVYDFESSAPVPSALHAQALQRHNNEIIPCRWSLGVDTLQVLVQPSLGSEFHQALHAALRDRIVGNIEITELNNSYGPDSGVFRVTKCGNDGIDLAGSPSLIGYEGPVRGLNLTGVNTAQLATKAAVALAHLTRFRQILSLGENAAQQLGPFQLTLNPELSRGNLSGGQEIGFMFRNTTKSQLHFTVLVLSSGFHVKQLYPSQDFPESVDPGDEVSFTFNITIPDTLNSYGEQRDIIRTVVTEGRRLSWKSLELPDIWNADQLSSERGGPRDGNVLSKCSKCSLWVKDNVILTRKQWMSHFVGS